MVDQRDDRLGAQHPVGDLSEPVLDRLASAPPESDFLEHLEGQQTGAKPVVEIVVGVGHLVRDVGRLRLDRISTVAILGDALGIALEHDITVYDASYVAASRLVDAPLITSDERLIAKLGDLRGQVIHFADGAD